MGEEMKPQIILDFTSAHHRVNFIHEYGEEVLSVLRVSANEANPTEILRFELPPKLDYDYVDPDTKLKYRKQDEEEKKVYAVFQKGKEIPNEPSAIWVYYFKRYE